MCVDANSAEVVGMKKRDEKEVVVEEGKGGSD